MYWLWHHCVYPTEDVLRRTLLAPRLRLEQSRTVSSVLVFDKRTFFDLFLRSIPILPSCIIYVVQLSFMPHIAIYGPLSHIVIDSDRVGICNACGAGVKMAEMPNSICTCIDIFAPDSHVFGRKGAWSS